MRSILSAIFKLTSGLIILFIVLLNFRLYYSPTFKIKNNQQYNEDVYCQLRFLESEINNGAAIEMQQQFPEGFIFLHSIYALSWINLIEPLDYNHPIFNEGIREINKCIKEISSPSGKDIFQSDLPLSYGAFYNSWCNYVIGKKLMLEYPDHMDTTQVRQFKNTCQQISEALQQTNLPFLETYSFQTWPADIMGSIVSLRLHDQMFGRTYSNQIDLWVDQCKTHLDSAGLIPHSVNSVNCMPVESARGSSQSLILNFLIDIDSAFAKEQFEIYRSQFLTTRFSLPGIREYPKGQSGTGDIDSGPVILDIGGAASIVGQRAFGRNADWTIYQGLRNSVELFGIGWKSADEKKYLLGQLPIADAFIAWSNSLENSDDTMGNTKNWRWQIQLLSLCISFLIIYGCKKF